MNTYIALLGFDFFLSLKLQNRPLIFQLATGLFPLFLKMNMIFWFDFLT